jgi:hypothetical protein
VNIGANVVSPSNDFSNLYPRLISFRTGGLITGFLGLAMCPWKLLGNTGRYIFGWLVGYSGLLGPVAGIMIADYFFIRKTELDVNSLYHREGAYHYTKGINPRAVVALVLGVAIALIGLACPPLHFLYDYAWFVGSLLPEFCIFALMKLVAPAFTRQPQDDGSMKPAFPDLSAGTVFDRVYASTSASAMPVLIERGDAESSSSFVTINGGAMTKWLTQACCATPSPSSWLRSDRQPAACPRFIEHGVEGLLRFAILHDLDGKEQAQAAHIAYRGMFRLERLKLLAHIGLKLCSALDKLEPLHLFNGGDGGPERDGVRLIRVAVREVVVLKVVRDLCGWWRRGRAAHRPK